MKKRKNGSSGTQLTKVNTESTETSDVNAFLDAFATMSPDIRDEIARRLPTYNKLLALKAKTFGEFALLASERARGRDVFAPYIDFSKLTPPCPFCKSANVNHRSTKNYKYTCKDCEKTFRGNHKSISSNTKMSAETWLHVLYCLLSFCTIKETKEYCKISDSAYYYIRNRLFYAMQLMMEDVKLYGIIQCDNTFARVSYKGYCLEEPNYPEGSIHDMDIYIPRSPHKRGENPQSEKNINCACIYTAIDEFGHLVARYVGIGCATATKLARAVPRHKYLLNVPEQDPFQYMKSGSSKTNVDENLSRNSLLVSDKEKAILKYAEMIRIPNESHVFRRGSTQLKLAEGEHDIQRVNWVHKELQKFLKRCNDVSTKYLPGYLHMFEFIMNTGASERAISRLFEILATPGMHKSDDFFDKLYVTPNFLVEWSEDETLFKNIPYNHLLTVYLFNMKKTNQAKGKSGKISNERIMEETGYSEKSIYRIYKMYSSSGLVDTICKKMESKIKLAKDNSSKTNVIKKSDDLVRKPIEDIYFTYYDEYCSMYQKPPEEQMSAAAFLKVLNEKYGANANETTLYRKFDWIEKYKLRRLSFRSLKKEAAEAIRLYRAEKHLEKCFEYLSIFEAIEKEYAKRNEKISKDELYRLVSSQTGRTAEVIKKDIQLAKRHKYKGKG